MSPPSVDEEATPLLKSLSPFRRTSSSVHGIVKKAKTSVASVTTAATAPVGGGGGSVSSSTTYESIPKDDLIEPVEALDPLAGGGNSSNHRLPLVKSAPAKAPYRRKARHRSRSLWWINEFRHWWKSSRLLVRLAGLDALARGSWDDVLVGIRPKGRKNGKLFFKSMKRLGQGGPMRGFLQRCHPFTRSLRIVVAAWRWLEAAKCRRIEVGVEEAMAFMGNRVSRMLSRFLVDYATRYGVWPAAHSLFRHHKEYESQYWHPATIIVILGILRAIAPFVASFQGSRFGRVLSRMFFHNAKNRWDPIEDESVRHVHLNSDDCVERDEIDENANLAKLAKKVAKALGKSTNQGGDLTQNDALAGEGFRQIGAGSGGYTVYECHRRIDECDRITLLLHVTPYGPSICDVLPRYCVLEVEESCDRRGAWIDWTGPSVVEGYCYQGAFFSPHHFAELKHRYDSQLACYDRACAHRTGNPPPADQPSLKAFLAMGKLPKKKGRIDWEFSQMKSRVDKLARHLRSKANASGCKGVILYFEGLDCSGKSSTGGLVQQALEEAGFEVEMRQHNRPPTEEQRLRPWMERFESPDVASSTIKPAMVWDRGPAGDFVYGALAHASMNVKRARYQEFLEFEAKCQEQGILFCKLMFITNRDSIAATLGKRLAQKMMVKDLREWIAASSPSSLEDQLTTQEGLDEVEHHIDPTDFVAFNLYLKNLHKFMNFALNTDSEVNPWIVVNTTDRFRARKHLLRTFQHRFDTFDRRRKIDTEVNQVVDIYDMLEQKPTFRLATLGVLMFMLFVIGFYLENTKFEPFHVEFLPQNV